MNKAGFTADPGAASHLAHGFDDELVVMREEEDAARLARRGQLSQRLVTCQSQAYSSLMTRGWKHMCAALAEACQHLWLLPMNEAKSMHLLLYICKHSLCVWQGCNLADLTGG